MIEDNYNDDIELLDEPEVVDAGDGTLYEHWKIEVDPGQAPVRIDKFLSEKNPYQSRNRIQNAADAGFIHVNGKPVKSNYKVRPNDVITLMLPSQARHQYCGRGYSAEYCVRGRCADGGQQGGWHGSSSWCR